MGRGLLSKYLAKARHKKILPYLKGHVLDLGCGFGQVYREYHDRMDAYVGIEYTKEHVEKLRKEFPRVKFYQRNIDQDLLHLEERFDCVLMIALIEHLFNQKFIMDQVVDVLKPGGIVVITTPTPWGNDIVHRLGASIGLFAKSAVNHHIIIYNRLRMETLAQKIGLKLYRYHKFQFGCNQLAVLKKTDETNINSI